MPKTVGVGPGPGPLRSCLRQIRLCYRPVFLHACVTCSALPSNKSNFFLMIWRVDLAFKYKLVYPLMHGRFYRPTTFIESGIKWFFYLHLAYPYYCFYYIRVLGLKKDLRCVLFIFKISKLKSFWVFSKNIYRNELHASFLPYFDTQHSICDFFFFTLFVCGSSNFFVLIKIKIL